MPRITDERREARRAEIVAAARRCFAREGFHATSMPDIAAEAGLSPGASYRYFASKDDLVLEVAGEAFGAMFGPVEHVDGAGPAPTVADLVVAATAAVGEAPEATAAPVDELLRCGVQVWAELLRHEGLRRRASAGFEGVRARLADVLRRGQEAGTVPVDVDPDHGARVVMALLHGFMLQRAAFALDDVAGFDRAVRGLIRG